MIQTGQVTEVEGTIFTGVEGNIVKIHPKTHAHLMLTQVNVKRVLSIILVSKVKVNILTRSCPQIVSQKSGTLRWRKIKKYLLTM